MDHLATTASPLIVPPGAEGSRICVRVIDADGRQSDTIEYVPVEDVTLEDLPAPEPLAIGTAVSPGPWYRCDAIRAQYR